MDEIKKNIDESWKEATEKEKQAQKETGKLMPPDPDFKFFVTTLGLQASIFLGQIANPSTEKIEEDLTQAKFIIDTLAMLKEKTKGNLNKDEEDLIETVLYELRMIFISKQKGESK